MTSRAVQETGTSSSEELHTGRRSLPMSVEADTQESIDVFDLHLGDIVVTSITQYEEPSDQGLPSAAQGVGTAQEVVPATVHVGAALGIKLRAPPLPELVEPRHRSECDVGNQRATVTISHLKGEERKRKNTGKCSTKM